MISAASSILKKMNFGMKIYQKVIWDYKTKRSVLQRIETVVYLLEENMAALKERILQELNRDIIVNIKLLGVNEWSLYLRTGTKILTIY